jgi:dihydrofolate reductase
MKGLALIAAMSRNHVIGKDGDLPWRIKEDLRHFRRVTTDHRVMIMGRKTWDSIGKALPNRDTIVVTRQDLELEGAHVVHSPLEALHLAWTYHDVPCVVGGGALYKWALPIATKMYLTHIDRDVEGDTYFPLWNPAEWVDEGSFGLAEGVSATRYARVR